MELRCSVDRQSVIRHALGGILGVCALLAAPQALASVSVRLQDSGQLAFPITSSSADGRAEVAWNGVGANGTAYADMTTGKLGVYAYKANFGVLDVTSSLYERLSFNLGGVASNAVTPVTFVLALDGDLSNSSVEYRYQFAGSGGVSRYLYLNAGRFEGDYLGTDCSVLGNASALTASCTLNLLGPNPQVELNGSLRALAEYGSAASPSVVDYLHTSAISIVVPQGVTWTSQSGTFLTAAAGPASGTVPEPMAWTLMISGFGMAGVALRRKTRIALGYAVHQKVAAPPRVRRRGSAHPRRRLVGRELRASRAGPGAR